jgi:alpha-D-ribose 1-methylphosphonate 5-triphosphate synthase subunit PhnG
MSSKFRRPARAQFCNLSVSRFGVAQEKVWISLTLYRLETNVPAATALGLASETPAMRTKAKTSGSDHGAAGCRDAMAIYAEASLAELKSGLEIIGEWGHADVRKPETGLVMIQARIGGDGAPFNLGEATVTRAAVRIESGNIGFSYILGRDQEKARLAALCDALWQNQSTRQAVETHVLTPVRERLARERKEAAARTAATRVDFFTLVRGEDAL